MFVHESQKTSLNLKIRLSYLDDESCESIKSFSGSSNSDLTGEEKELCAELIGLQPYKLSQCLITVKIQKRHLKVKTFVLETKAGVNVGCAVRMKSENEE